MTLLKYVMVAMLLIASVMLFQDLVGFARRVAEEKNHEKRKKLVVGGLGKVALIVLFAWMLTRFLNVI